MKRVFWFGVGVAAGVGLSRKASATARKASPAGVAENVGSAVRELAEALGAFGADVRAGMSEREAELNDTVGQLPGYAPAARHAVRAPATPTPGPRARRAGG